MRIYLDSCALSRLTDTSTELRVRREKIAVLSIFRRIQHGTVDWVASSILEAEIRKNPNALSRDAALSMFKFTSEVWVPDPSIAARGGFLNTAGYGKFDALHLAIAEASKVDWFITTDDRFLRKIQRGLGNPTTPAANPLNWIKQVKP